MAAKDLQGYLSQQFQGRDSFLDNVLLPIFRDIHFEDAWDIEMLEDDELQGIASRTGVVSVLKYGTFEVPHNPVEVYDITVCNRVMMRRNRVGIQQIIHKIIGTHSSAFIIFHYESTDAWDWRFTFCHKDDKVVTENKRYTFILGPGQSCRTAAQNFQKLFDKNGKITKMDLENAFSVEALSKDFFEKYKVHYGNFVAYVIGKEYIDKGEGKGEWRVNDKLKPSDLFYALGKDEKRVRDYVKKLLGRIVFLHFLQKKGWLGANENWENGKTDFMFRLFDKAKTEQKANFLDEILEPLFSCLDTPLDQRDEVFDTKVDELRSVRVPFLGGLFERTEDDKAVSVFPSDLFKELFKFLSEYNFTIDENDPNDAQVGVDPEMLGRIFENLLEDNKDKGAFYTPKEIVQYMCRESLIAYLQTDVEDESTKNAIRNFVTTHDVSVLGGKESSLAQNVSQRLKDVKICDPAIGSGAFPMGLLNELFLCRGVIEDFENAAAIKRHIIQQNIYGVDIEKGAVEIARLRFWLSLITDADTPEVLPNMDFKIMQGNSLLEQYKGFDLSHIMETKTEIHSGYQFSMFDDDLDVIRAEVKRTIQDYYGEQNHDMRRTMREGIQQKIQRQIEVQGINVDISDIKDIAATDQFFLWHTWFSEVFENGGFDIVIGNPPYIQLQADGGSLGKLYQDKGFETFASTGDIYCLFYELGHKLLRSNGHLCYITSNKWMRTGYGEKLRNFLSSKTNPLIILDFGGVQIFETANIDTVIVEYAKANNEDCTKALSMTLENAKEYKDLTSFFSTHSVIMPFSTNNSWIIKDKQFQEIKKHVEIQGKPLYEWEIEIYRGIITGLNDAFYVNSEQRDVILNRCATKEERQLTESLIRPILRGKDIKPYAYSWADIWLIGTFPAKNLDINNYPCVEQHLLSFGKERLEQTGKKYIINGETIKARKKTSNDWYETSDSIKYWKSFDKPKIIYPNMTKFLPFVYDEEGIWTNQKCFILTGKHLAYLTAFFNSKLFKYCFSDNFPTLGEDRRELSKIFFDKIPIKEVSEEIDRGFKEKVLEIQKQKNISPLADTSALEHEIDLLVYDLYGLTPDEIAIVEGTSNA